MYDVIVAGGGPAGASAAYHLARGGAKVLVVDHEDVPGGRYKTCGGGFTDKLFWSFPREVVEPVIENRIMTMRLRLSRSCVIEHRAPWPICSMSMRDRLDRVLINAAMEAGAAYLQERVLGMQDGALALKNGAQLKAAHVVAADGAYSAIGRALGLPRHRRTVVAVEDEAHGSYRESWDGKMEVVQTVRPIGYYWVFPKADHLSTGFGGPKGSARKVKRWTLEYTERHLDRPTHSLSGHYIPLRDPGYPAMANGVYLVGDVAGAVDPCTGEGISMGAWTGKMAAAAVLGGKPEGYRAFMRELDREFVAARAFRNWLVIKVNLMANRVVKDDAYWQSFFRIVKGDVTYRDWHRRANPAMKALLRLADRLAPI